MACWVLAGKVGVGRNIACQNICYGNSEVLRGLRSCFPERDTVGGKISKHPQARVDSFVLCQDWKREVLAAPAKIRHQYSVCWCDLILVRTEHRRKSQVVSQAVQVIDHMSRFFSNGSTIWPPTSGLGWNWRPKPGVPLAEEQPFITAGENSPSVRWLWKVPSIVLRYSKLKLVTSSD